MTIAVIILALQSCPTDDASFQCRFVLVGHSIAMTLREYDTIAAQGAFARLHGLARPITHPLGRFISP